ALVHDAVGDLRGPRDRELGAGRDGGRAGAVDELRDGEAALAARDAVERPRADPRVVVLLVAGAGRRQVVADVHAAVRARRDRRARGRGEDRPDELAAPGDVDLIGVDEVPQDARRGLAERGAREVVRTHAVVVDVVRGHRDRAADDVDHDGRVGRDPGEEELGRAVEV